MYIMCTAQISWLKHMYCAFVSSKRHKRTIKFLCFSFVFSFIFMRQIKINGSALACHFQKNCKYSWAFKINFNFHRSTPLKSTLLHMADVDSMKILCQLFNGWNGIGWRFNDWWVKAVVNKSMGCSACVGLFYFYFFDDDRTDSTDGFYSISKISIFIPNTSHTHFKIQWHQLRLIFSLPVLTKLDRLFVLLLFLSLKSEVIWRWLMLVDKYVSGTFQASHQ